jgi:hypothetical protein
VKFGKQAHAVSLNNLPQQNFCGERIESLMPNVVTR